MVLPDFDRRTSAPSAARAGVTAAGPIFIHQLTSLGAHFKSGRVTELFRDEGRGPYWLAVSPDERWLLYTKNPFWTSELMLVENFR
jgi:hypothetical protein